MIFLLDANVRTVKWNGIPLHEASSAIVKEEINSDFTLTVRYPITDSGIYQLIKEDMLIKAPTPVLGAQLFRIKKPIENDDSLDITAYHVSDDIMKRSITPVSVVGQGCAMALSQMVQNAKTGLGDFSFTSDIMDSRTFNTTETETLYSVLMDGKHSIVGTWEGELVRDNFALSIKRSRGDDRGVVITTHKNLKSYQRTKNSQGVVTRIYARSTFKPDGAEDEVTLRVTVDSPLINSYPYINEKEYENNNAETVEDLRKWAEAKFTNEGIDKVSDAIEIEAYELDGQIVHLGDTVNIKSRKHSADLYKKAIAYEFNALTEEYISITFDDKPGVGGSGVSSGLSTAADAILGASATAQDVVVERAVKNANAAFNAEFDKRVEAINDDIEKAKADAEVYADSIRQDITQNFDAFEQEYQANNTAQEQQVSDIRAQATDAKTLAQQAQQIGTQAKSDAANVLIKALQYKAEAIAEARRLDVVERQASETKLATAKSQAVAEATRLVANAKSTLETQISSAKKSIDDAQKTLDAQSQKINSQAKELLAQAQAQTELTKRTEAVEKTADGTKTALTELSKTVNSQTGQIDSVSKRTKAVEDGLTGLTTRYENLQSGFNNLILKSDDLENPHKQTGAKTTVTSENDYYVITSTGYTDNAWGGMSWNMSIDDVKNSDTFSLLMPVYVDSSVALDDSFVFAIKDHATNKTAYSYKIPQNIKDQWFDVSLTFSVNRDLMFGNYPFYVYLVKNGKVRIKPPTLVKGPIKPLSHLSSAEDIRTEIAEYHQSAIENYSNLSKNLQTTDGKINDANTLVRQTAEAIKSYAKQSSLDTLSIRVNRAETSLTQQADKIELKASKEDVDTLANRVNTAETSLTTQAGQIALKASQSDLSKLSSRVSSAESSLQVQAGEIASRVKTSDFDQAKQRITSAESSITQLGNRITTEISETKSLIPTKTSGNMLLKSNMGWTDKHLVKYQLAESVIAGRQYTAVAKWQSDDSTQVANVGLENTQTDSKVSQWVTLQKDPQSGLWIGTFTAKQPVQAGKTFAFATVARDGIGSADWVTLVEGPVALTSWEPNQSEVISDIETVKTTITQTAQGQEQLSTRLSQAEGKVTTAETNIRQLVSDVSSKVSQRDFDTATGRITNAETLIRQHTDKIASLVTKADFNSATGRLSTLETSVTQQAGEITKRLTATQVDQAITGKGYQTKAQVDSNITGRGYITSSALQPYATTVIVQNLVTETASSFERKITATKQDILAGTVTLTAFNEAKTTLDAHKRLIGDGSSISQAIQSASKFERSIVAGGDIYQAIETAKGLLQEVTGANGLKTQMSQLAGSWAVKNLTSAGTVLNQINLLANGTNRIDGRLTHITGQTLIDNAVIKSAMIDKLKTANFEAGSVTAIILGAEAVTADKLKVDQALFNKLSANEAYLKTLFAKDAFVTQVQSVSLSADKIMGGLLKSTNGDIQWDLNSSLLTFKNDSRIIFNSPENTISYTKKNTAAMLKFNDAEYNAPEMTIGVNRQGALKTDISVFTGLRIRGFTYSNGNTVDELHLIGDKTYITAGYRTGGFLFSTSSSQGIIPINNRQASLGNSTSRFTTLYCDDVNVRASSSTVYSLREVLAKLATATGVKL